jgi:uncharacterized protein YjbI with pentapeptide repeats
VGAMAEGKGTHTSEQEKGPDKRPLWWKRLWAWTEFGKKSGWDLLQLLIVPLALAVIGFVFTMQQDQRQQQIENQRAQAERELAEQRAQDEALQAYLDQMSSLLLEKDLRQCEGDSEVRTLARARTLTVISRLDPTRKVAVMEFLSEADLVGSGLESNHIISLSGADLSGADLGGSRSVIGSLGAAGGHDVGTAADLFGADLAEANLIGTDLSNVMMYGVELFQAVLSGTDMTGAVLTFADLREANLREADLSPAILSNADLSYANLRGANLSKAYLNNANLSNADLSDANLNGAFGVTGAQLAKARSLEGATMPDGQTLQSDTKPNRPTFKEWLKEGDTKPKVPDVLKDQ